MEALTKFLGVLAKNLGVTIVLIVAICLFIWFSEGLLPGIVAALSALVAYTCASMLYKEFKTTPTPKKSKK